MFFVWILFYQNLRSKRTKKKWNRLNPVGCQSYAKFPAPKSTIVLHKFIYELSHSFLLTQLSEVYGSSAGPDLLTAGQGFKQPSRGLRTSDARWLPGGWNGLGKRGMVRAGKIKGSGRAERKTTATTLIDIWMRLRRRLRQIKPRLHCGSNVSTSTVAPNSPTQFKANCPLTLPCIGIVRLFFRAM